MGPKPPLMFHAGPLSNGMPALFGKQGAVVAKPGALERRRGLAFREEFTRTGSAATGVPEWFSPDTDRRVSLELSRPIEAFLGRPASSICAWVVD